MVNSNTIAVPSLPKNKKYMVLRQKYIAIFTRKHDNCQDVGLDSKRFFSNQIWQASTRSTAKKYCSAIMKIRKS